MSVILQPRFIIPRCLIKDDLVHVGDDWTYHVTCEAVDGLANRVTLYDGCSQCTISDENELEEQFSSFTSTCTSSTMYSNSSVDFAPISTEFLENFFCHASEGIHLEEFDFDSTVQTTQIEETLCLTDSQSCDSAGQPVVLTHIKQQDSSNNMQYVPSADTVDMLPNELLGQLPDGIIYQELDNASVDYVTDSALIEILTSEKQITHEQPTILFLEENSDYGDDLQRVDREMFQAKNEEVKKYMDEPLDHISLPDGPQSKTRGKHACSSCDETFTSLLKLRTHLINKNSHQTQEQNVPPFPRNQRTKEQRNSQQTTEHNGDIENFTCNKCNRKFSCRERWQSHSRDHSDPDLECPRCAKVLASRASLKAHMKIHDRKFSCEYCIRTYETDEQLRSHALKKHSKFLCKECDFICRNKSELDAHLEIHKTISQNILEEECGLDGVFSIDKVEYDQNIGYEEDEEVVVDDDDMGLLVVERLATHFEDDINFLQDVDYYVEENDDEMVESFEVRHGKSDELDSAYQTVSDIIHIESRNRQVNKKEKLTRDCHKCEKHFDRGSDYKRHAIEHVVQETLHCAERDPAGSQVFLCRLCEDGRFGRVDNLRAHLRDHLKLRLYQCNKCFKTFSDSSNYSKHKKVHGSAVYQCDTCKRKFNTRKMITQHMDYHKKTQPFSCPHCEKVCYFESTLKKHINAHHKTKGKGAFSCQNCYVKFPSMKHKWDHQWRDHGIRKKVNDCGQCEAKFRKYSELKRHLKENH